MSSGSHCVRWPINTTAGTADFENGDPTLQHAPEDAFIWLGIVLLTREAGEYIQELEVLKTQFEAQEAGMLITT